jgi:hypothetical protein
MARSPLPDRQRSSACQIHATGDKGDADPICFARPLPEERYREQRRQRRHQSTEGRATRSAEDDNCAPLQNKRNDGHDDALEERLNREVGERYRPSLAPYKAK